MLGATCRVMCSYTVAEMPNVTVHPCQLIVIEHERTQSRQAKDVESPAQLVVTQIQHLQAEHGRKTVHACSKTACFFTIFICRLQYALE